MDQRLRSISCLVAVAATCVITSALSGCSAEERRFAEPSAGAGGTGATGGTGGTGGSSNAGVWDQSNWDEATWQ
jgi:hypothetical protein